MHSPLRLWSTLKGLHTEAIAEIVWRDVPKRAFPHHGTIFLGESERCKRRRYLRTSPVAHNVGGLIKESFTFFFLVNAQLLLGDITVGLREHFLVRISVRISVRKYQKILINSY